MDSVVASEAIDPGSTPGTRTILRSGGAALGDDAEAVVIEVSEAVGAALDEFHFAVEAFGDAVVAGEAPHADDLLRPIMEGLGEGVSVFEAAGFERLDKRQ